MVKKWVYLFGEGNKEMADLLGGKGAGLAEMTKAGLPVPPGFTITTEACNAYFANGKTFPEGMWNEVLNAIKALEKQTGKKFGNSANPLLVSCRSGARVSMPGMMDTVLNIGFNPKVLEGFAKLVGNERVAWDAYRRLIQMFGNIVKGIERHKFEVILDAYKARTKGGKDTDLTAAMLKDVVKEFKALYKQVLKEEFPDDPVAQLREAVAAVFNSWFGPPAIAYRKAENISDDWGTAVNIQTMVFGNMGDNSGTGVAFTRNPANGDKQVWGEYLINAQGEDVVAGIRTPQPIAALGKELPEAYDEFVKICDRLERHYRDMQDLEFTIERNKLWMLQTRAAKRTATAAVKVAVDMVKEGLLTKEEALTRVTPGQVEQFLHPGFDPAAIQHAREQGKILAWGLNASPGAASGIAIFDAATAERRGKAGEKVILVRPDTNPDDVHGVIAARGVLTQHGGMTCVAGDTRVLTDKGFLRAEEAYEQIARGEPLGILAFDCSSGHSVWRRVIAAGRRRADVCRITVSQTGRAQENTVQLTPDHKMMTVENRQLQKKELSSCLRDRDPLCVVTKIPAIKEPLLKQADLAYSAGAIFTDGHLRLGPTKGSVTFSQTRVPGKLSFISARSSSLQNAFGVPFSYARHRSSRAVLEGRVISGSAQDLICFRREPASVLKATWDGIVPWVLSLDHESLLEFLAGVLDGDGAFHQSSNRINVFIDKEPLLQAVVTACLRLGLVPQVTRNRGIHNVQITTNFGPLLEHTRRVRGSERKRLYGYRLFSVRALFGDVVNQVNPQGRVRSAMKRNVMFGADKIERDILPLSPPSFAGALEAILKSEIRMCRMRQVGSLEPATVYNFEVNAQDERDKNFIVFTKQYTPVLVSNSHAAVVARGWGKAAVVGCESIKIDMTTRTFRTADKLVHEGDEISIDGTTGAVFEGAIATVEPKFEETSELGTLLRWADDVRRLGVRANADTPDDAARARAYGAKGIGLCRTERMFTEGGRRAIVVKMIMSADSQERKAFLRELLPFQRQDFEGIFRVMNGYPVTIRLLDPPMHEFLPPRDKLLEELYQVRFEVQCNPTPDQAKKLEKKLAELEAVLAVVQRLWETNPMMGLRGCRAGIMYEGLTEMQTRAIFEAACNVAKEGIQVTPEVMIPLVSHANELKIQRETLEKIAKDIMKEKCIQIPYKFGTMIETPRAAVTADLIAPYADFYSFGTNDLTQMTFGVSRDDAEGKFLREYVTRGILPDNPFETIDQEGVGLLMKIAVQKGHTGNPKIEIGGCGEHFGDPRSIEFSHKVGLDYVSCSSFRVPIARLAAAQATLAHNNSHRKLKATD